MAALAVLLIASFFASVDFFSTPTQIGNTIIDWGPEDNDVLTPWGMYVVADGKDFTVHINVFGWRHLLSVYRARDRGR
jgi:hypothetical protein